MKLNKKVGLLTLAVLSLFGMAKSPAGGRLRDTAPAVREAQDSTVVGYDGSNNFNLYNSYSLTNASPATSTNSNEYFWATDSSFNRYTTYFKTKESTYKQYTYMAIAVPKLYGTLTTAFKVNARVCWGGEDDDIFYGYSGVSLSGVNIPYNLTSDTNNNYYCFKTVNYTSVFAGVVGLESSHVISGSTCFTVFNYLPANRLVNGSTKEIHISVDANKTEAEIVSGVTAEDIFGVSCTVTVKTSDYVTGKVGTYHIVLQATDSYGNTATATLVVYVEDRTAPVVTKKSDISVRYGTSLSSADALSHYGITDNVDKTFTTSWTLPANFKFDNALSYGKYTLVLSVKDSAGNETKVNVLVNVYDDVPPAIARKDGASDSVLIYGYSNTHELTINALLALYTATDVVSGACTVYVKSGLLTDGSLDTSIGDHSLVLGAKDLVGNEAVKTINYHIQVDVPPVFILSDELIQVTASLPLSLNDLTKALSAMPTSSGSGTASVNSVSGTRVLSARKFFARTDIQVNQDDFNAYLAGSSVVGAKYAVRYTYVDDVTGEIKDSVVYLLVAEDPAADAVPEKKLNWFMQFFTVDVPKFFCHTLPEFFQKQWNWLRGVFTKGRTDCFITNADWDAKFPATAVSDSGDGDASASVVSSPASDSSASDKA